MARASPRDALASSEIFLRAADMEVEESDQTVLYPSGAIAATLSRVAGDKIITIFSPKGRLLLLFNEKGVGSAHYKSTKPWLVTTEQGYTLTSEEGAIMERGTWPRNKAGSAAALEVNEYLTVTFNDQRDILATLRIGEMKKVFQCGEQLRRADTQLNLDITSIRARQKASGPSGSVYVTPGPHHFRSAAPGVGALKSTLRSLGTLSPVSGTVKELSSLDSRLSSIDLWGGGSGKSLSPSSTLSGTMSGTLRKKQLPDDFGSPEMSDTMVKLGRRPKPLVHKAGRKSLPWLSQGEAVKGGEGNRDELLVCFFTAEWNPVCAKMEAQVQTAFARVVEDTTLASYFKFVKTSASEGSVFKNKYNVRSAPFFFFFYEGQLVEATNNLSSSQEIKEAAIEALAKGRKKQFLPETFSFRNRVDNTLLDGISPSMLS